MSRLMRMAYGHGGTRLERIRVAASHGESPPAPGWLRLLLLAVWLAIPVLVSRYAIPTATRPTTVIDTSRLDVQPPPPLETSIIAEPLRVKAAEPPQPAPVQSAQKPLEQPQEEVPSAAITRPSVAKAPDIMEYQPRIARERARTGEEPVSPSSPRLRRDTAPGEPPALPTAITRTRGIAATEAVAAKERLAPLRRTAAEGPSQNVAPAQRPVTRRSRPADAETLEGSAPRIAVARERTQAAAAGDGADAPSVGLGRGVSLMSLEICASTQEEEDAVKAVLGVVGSLPSCADEKGMFQFRGTKRISSFNLIIYTNGRRPSNRCEELKNAYRCLKGR